MATWNPWHTLESVRRELDRVFDDAGTRAAPAFRTAFQPGRAARQYPRINLCEDTDAVYLEALAPGVDAAALEISVVGKTLRISGEKRRVAGEVTPDAFHRSERATGQFVRQIPLPMEVDEQHVQANYKDGLLMITLPKAEKAKPKQIAVPMS